MTAALVIPATLTLPVAGSLAGDAEFATRLGGVGDARRLEITDGLAVEGHSPGVGNLCGLRSGKAEQCREGDIHFTASSTSMKETGI